MRKTDWGSKFWRWSRHWFAGGRARAELEVHGHLFYEETSHLRPPPRITVDQIQNEEEVAAKMAERLDDGYPYQFCRAP